MLPAIVSRSAGLAGYAASRGDALIFVVGDLPTPPLLRINSSPRG